LNQLGVELYPAGSGRTHTITEALSVSRKSGNCIIAGRLVTVDVDAGIGTLRDASGSASLRLHSDSDVRSQSLFKELIAGDIVECRVVTECDAIQIRDLRLLVPSYRTFPEHIPDSAVTLKSNILKYTAQFFDEHGFLGVDTPYFMAEPDLTPGITSFKTEFHDPAGRAISYYLQTSPEHYMKRLLALGYENIYQICRFFRDGERYATHHPEFVGLEWYQAYSDYRSVMQTMEEYIASLAVSLHGESLITYQGRTIDLTPPWTRTTVRDLILEHAGIDLKHNWTLESFKKCVAARDVEVSEDDTWEDVFHRLFLKKIESNLPHDRPIILTEYPVCLPSLARCTEEDDRFVERFELYIGGLELANAFTELNDPEEQRTRFTEQLPGEQARGYDGGVDEAFLAALEYGMPPAAGIALGLDRLTMLFADTTSIDDVIAFRNF